MIERSVARKRTSFAPGEGAGSAGRAPGGATDQAAAAGGDRRLALTTSEVARRLGVSLGTVRRWSDHGHLPSYRTPGGQRRFSADDVETFVTSLGRGPGGRQ